MSEYTAISSEISKQKTKQSKLEGNIELKLFGEIEKLYSYHLAYGYKSLGEWPEASIWLEELQGEAFLG